MQTLAAASFLCETEKFAGFPSALCCDVIYNAKLVAWQEIGGALWEESFSLRTYLFCSVALQTLVSASWAQQVGFFGTATYDWHWMQTLVVANVLCQTWCHDFMCCTHVLYCA